MKDDDRLAHRGHSETGRLRWRTARRARPPTNDNITGPINNTRVVSARAQYQNAEQRRSSEQLRCLERGGAKVDWQVRRVARGPGVRGDRGHCDAPPRLHLEHLAEQVARTRTHPRRHLVDAALHEQSMHNTGCANTRVNTLIVRVYNQRVNLLWVSSEFEDT